MLYVLFEVVQAKFISKRKQTTVFYFSLIRFVESFFSRMDINAGGVTKSFERFLRVIPPPAAMLEK